MIFCYSSHYISTSYNSACICKHGASSKYVFVSFLFISGKQQVVSTSCKFFFPSFLLRTSSENGCFWLPPFYLFDMLVLLCY